MKFIHAADLHLDSPFLGLRDEAMTESLETIIRQSTFESAKQIFTDAIDQQVDFVLLAGDLFDRNEQSVAAKYFLDQQLQRLNEVNIPVLIIFGNHDYYAGDIEQLGFPANTFVFGNQVETHQLTLTSGETVAISGFSFANQWVRERMINDYPQRQAVDWHLGMLHGSAEGIHSTEGVYAPFSITELQAKNYDYWALGHIHLRQSLDEEETINYVGNTQGRHINESGPKGYLLVESKQHQLQSSFHATATIDWQRYLIRATGVTSTELINQIFAELSEQKFKQLQLIRIEITADTLNDEQIAEINSGQLLTVLQQQNQTIWQQYHFWVTSIKLTEVTNQLNDTIDGRFFTEAEADIFTETQYKELLQPFAKYPFVAAEILNDDSEQQIHNFATQTLVTHIKNEGAAD